MKNMEVSDVTKAYRSAIADRATWFYLLLRTAEEKGVDGEELAAKAITEYGVEKGKQLGETRKTLRALSEDAFFLSARGCRPFGGTLFLSTPQD